MAGCWCHPSPKQKGDSLISRAPCVEQGMFAGLVLLLAACVGGGGGSSGSGPSLSVSTASVTFTALRNGPAPASQQVDVSIQGGSVFVETTQNGSTFTHSFAITGQTTGIITVTPTSPTMAPGTYTGTITIRGCRDTFCTGGDVAGSPQVISVTYAIQPAGISASPQSLNFSQPEGGSPPAAQTVMLSEIGNASYAWNASILYSQGSGWLSVNGGSQATGASLPSSLSIGITTPQSIGTYGALVRIAGNGNTTDVPVIYVVSKSLSPSPGSLSYTVGNTPLPIDLTRQVSLNAFLGVTWTAASNATWLSISPASGGSSDSLSISLIQSEVDAKNNGRYFATVTVTPSVGSVATIPVTLTVARTQVNYVSPYIAIANTQNEVVIRGDNLDQATITNVKFGTSAAASFNPVSSTEIRAMHPNLAPGSYAVQVETNLGIARSLANNLVAVAAQGYAAATIAYPNATAKQPLDIIYDAERQALLVGVAYPTPGSSGEIFRYPFTGSAWATTPASVAIASFRDLALSFDGRQLIAVSDFAVQKIDAAALTMGTVTPPLVFETFFKGVAMANDGNAILTTGSSRFEGGATFAWFYLVREDRVSLGFGSVIEIVRGTPGSSADGSRVILSQSSPDPTPSYDGQYDSRSGVFSFIPSPIPGMPLTWPSTPIRPKLDRKATRLVLNGYIVIKNSDYSHQSFLPPVAPGDSAAVALSPDGTRAYQYVSGTLLRTFDVSSPDQGVSEIGTGTVLLSDPGANPVMTVSPDGGTLFIAGADAIVVVPAP